MSKISGEINAAMLRISQGDAKRIADLEHTVEFQKEAWANDCNERDALAAKVDRLRLAIIMTCCDPHGRVCFRGSEGDREILQRALDETSPS